MKSLLPQALAAARWKPALLFLGTSVFGEFQHAPLPIHFEAPLDIAEEAPSQFSSIVALAATAEGIELVRRRPEGRNLFQLVYADLEGNIDRVINVELDLEDRDAWGRWFRAANGDWEIISQPTGPQGEALSERWRINTATYAMDKLPLDGCTSIAALASTPAGGFICSLGPPKGWDSPILRSYSSDGRLDWEARGHTDTRVPIAKSIAVTVDGSIALLRADRPTLQRLSLQGAFIAEYDLSDIFADEDLHLTKVLANPGGGVYLVDEGVSGRIFSLTHDGKEAGRIIARYDNHRPSSRLARNLRVAPDGSFWTYDTATLVRLSTDGLALRRFDTVSNRARDSLAYAVCVGVDKGGRIVMADRHSATVAILTHEGRRLLTRNTAASSFDLGSSSLTPDAKENSILLQHPATKNKRSLLRLSELRQGFEEPPLGPGLVGYSDSAKAWWVAGRTSLTRSGIDGRAPHTIRTLADGRALENIVDMALSTDGSLAVLDSRHDGYTLSLYDKKGEAVRSFPVGDDGYCHNLSIEGRWIAWLVNETAYVYDLESDEGRFFTPFAGQENLGLKLGLLVNPPRLCVVSSRIRQVVHYSL